MSYRRKAQEKCRLKKLAKETETQYGAGAYFDRDKNRYIRYAAGGQNCRKFLKRKASKAVRRTNESYNNCSFKRVYNYWNELL